MSDIHVGVSAGDEFTQLGGLAAHAEQLGFESIWTGEHMTNFGPNLSGIPVMATFASCTKTMKVGAAITLFPLRHPTVVAKEISTLDIISGGRIIFGIGIGGENPKEFEACGIDVRERGPRTDEGLELVRKLWTGEPVTHKGRFFEMEDIVMEPTPVQKPGPPIYVAGRRDGAMRRAVLHGDGWFPYLYDPGRYRQSVDRIREVAAEKERDLSNFGWALYQFIAMEDTYERALEIGIENLGGNYNQDFTSIAPRYAALGTADQCLERLHEFYEAGAREFVLAPMTHQGENVASKLEQMAEELLPAIKGF